jgi:hypothetical protein
MQRDGRPIPAAGGLVSWPLLEPELLVSSIIIGLVFIVGGLSGTLALIGTNSGTALAVVGVFLVGRGIWRIRKQRARQVQAL